LDAEETIGGLIHASQIPQKLLGHTKAIVVFPNYDRRGSRRERSSDCSITEDWRMESTSFC
jgi:hypothetical protein